MSGIGVGIIQLILPKLSKRGEVRLRRHVWQ